ncbi:MAG: ABC transporter substrate-binding protein [Myxococcota bacterium]
MREGLLAALLLSSIAACGSTETEAPRGQLTIAMILPKSGAFSSAYQTLEGGARLAQKWINDAGGVLGMELVFDERDEAAGTNGVVPITDVANDLVSQGVQVWVGPQASDSALAAAPIAAANQRLLIAPSAGASQLSALADDDFVFRGIQVVSTAAVASARVAYAGGHTTASVLHLNNAVSTDQANTFANTFVAAGGTVLVNHGYDYDTANPSAFVAQAHLDAVFAGNPDVIFLYGTPTDAVAVLTAWDKMDWAGQWILGAVLASSDIAAAVGGPKIADALTYTAAAPAPADQVTINSAFQELNGFDLGDVNTTVVNSTLQSTILAALAIERAGVNDGTAIRDVLREVANAPGEPVMGAVDYRRAVDIVRSGGDLDFVGLSAPLELDARGDFVGNISERRFNANGGLDVVRVLVPGADF